MSMRRTQAESNKASKAAPAPPATMPAAEPPTDSLELASTSCSGRSTAPGTNAALVTR